MPHPGDDFADAVPAAEAAMLARLRAGEDAAFREFVEGNITRLLAVARRVTRNAVDAEDVVQEAFLSAFRSLDTFDGRSSLATWLHRIVVNAALMRLRADRSRVETSIEELQPRFQANGLHAEMPVAWQVDPDAAEAKAALWQAIEQLPAEFRAVLVLRDMDGLESKQVANQLGIGDALVRQRLHRGRLALVKLLAPTMEATR